MALFRPPRVDVARPDHGDGAVARENIELKESVFFELEFVLLTLSSVLLPVAIYGFLLFKRSISRWTVLLLGLVLIGLSGADVVLLQSLSEQAKATRSLIDDRIFAAELSIALYLLPAVFAGIGVNLISHVLVDHLKEAEQRFERRQARARHHID